MRRYFILALAIMAAMAKATATVTRSVFEGGRWILRQVAAPPSQAAAAGVDAAAEIEAMAAQAEAAAEAKAAALNHAPGITKADVDESLERQWGLAALAYMYRIEGADPADSACLDEAARWYLDRLTHDEKLTLTLAGSRRIGGHLLCTAPIQKLARAPTLAQYQMDAVLRSGTPSEDLDDQDLVFGTPSLAA